MNATLANNYHGGGNNVQVVKEQNVVGRYSIPPDDPSADVYAQHWGGNVQEKE